MSLTLRGGVLFDPACLERRAARELHVAGGCVAARAVRGARALDLRGALVLPGLVNAHDHLGLSSFPALGSPPYASLYDWAADVRGGADDSRARAALDVPHDERLLLGALRCLLAGVTAVVHHDPWHASLARRGPRAWSARLRLLRRQRVWLRGGLPVRVLARYEQAHSPGLERDLAVSRGRERHRGCLFLLHAAEGTDARAAAEIGALHAAGVLDRDTLLAHALGATPADIERLRASDTAVAWCPESNRRLYAAAAPEAALRDAGVRLGLGSDSPLSGVRDALSNLAAARRERVFDDLALLRLATLDSARVCRLPVGGFAPGDPADFVVVDDLERLLAGDRRALRLVLVAGRVLYGAKELTDAAGVATRALQVAGEPRALSADLATLLARLLRAHPALREAAWLQDVRCA